ncbi:polymer-forming protein, partial [Saliterribacillus persicus]
KEELVVAGQFHDKDDPEADIYRKIAPYEQDEDRNITASFTIEVPKLTIESENTKIQGGTVKGDVVVDADGFTLDETATIDGNLTFANADVEANATVAGEVTGEVTTE